MEQALQNSFTGLKLGKKHVGQTESYFTYSIIQRKWRGSPQLVMAFGLPMKQTPHLILEFWKVEVCLFHFPYLETFLFLIKSVSVFYEASSLPLKQQHLLISFSQQPFSSSPFFPFLFISLSHFYSILRKRESKMTTPKSAATPKTIKIIFLLSSTLALLHSFNVSISKTDSKLSSQQFARQIF